MNLWEMVGLVAGALFLLLGVVPAFVYMTCRMGAYGYFRGKFLALSESDAEIKQAKNP